MPPTTWKLRSAGVAVTGAALVALSAFGPTAPSADSSEPTASETERVLQREGGALGAVAAPDSASSTVVGARDVTSPDSADYSAADTDSPDSPNSTDSPDSPNSPDSPDSPDGFTDITGNAHEGNIRKVADAGVAAGFADGSFRPDAFVTRGQTATFLQRGYVLPDSGDDFCDTDDHAHAPGIRAVAGAGIAVGDRGCFNPDTAVTRGQMASFLARAEELATEAQGRFCDTSGHAHERTIAEVAAAGIVAGYADGCFGPNDAVTRGQMASFLARALGL